MEKWVLNILKKERRKRKQPLEVKRLNNNYYLYHSTTRWDRGSKKIRKVSRYVGRITRQGVIEKTERNVVRNVYHYGDAQFLFLMAQDMIKPLEKHFPQRWKELLACSLVKVLRPTPIKRIKSVWKTLHLSQNIDASLSPKTLSGILREVGADYAAQKGFFDELTKRSHMLVFDLSSVFSRSANLRLAERGHNAKRLFLPQISFLLFFSFTRKLPVRLRPVPGSVRDIKALEAVLDESKAKNCVLVLDTGFASYKLAKRLDDRFRFILPLRRDFTAIDYTMQLKNMFPYRGRGIKWGVKKLGKWFLYLFEDVKLRAEEESTFIGWIKEGKKRKEEYEKASRRFGKIALLSNMSRGGEEIYLMYKDRESIEVAFDALKNELENDKTYLGDDEAVRGYFFVSFLSLYLYYRVLNKLKEKKLSHKISVSDLLFELSKVYEVHIDKKKKFSEIPKKVENLVETLCMDIFPK